MLNNRLVDCSIIGVDCVKNDDINKKCDGVEYLGFDFYVRRDKTDEMISYIKLAIEELSVPLINITYDGQITVRENEVFDKERIFSTISREASYLINESNNRIKKKSITN